MIYGITFVDGLLEPHTEVRVLSSLSAADAWLTGSAGRYFEHSRQGKSYPRTKEAFEVLNYQITQRAIEARHEYDRGGHAVIDSETAKADIIREVGRKLTRSKHGILI